MQLSIVLALFVGATFAGGDAAAVEILDVRNEVQCEIRKTIDDSTVLLEALAVAGPAASGQYSLVIRKGGGSGTTHNRQGGRFSMGAGETRVLSSTMISVGPHEYFEAELTLELNGERRSCHTSG